MAWWLDALADPNNVQGGRFNPFNLARNFTSSGREDLQKRRGAVNAGYDQAVTEAQVAAHRAGYEKAINDLFGPDKVAASKNEQLRAQRGANVAQETGNEAAMFQLGNERADASALRQRTGFNTPQAASVVQNQQQIDQSKAAQDRAFELTLLGNENQMAQQNQAQANFQAEQALKERELGMQQSRDQAAAQHYKSAENVDLLKQYQDSLMFSGRPEAESVRGAIGARLGQNGMPLPAPKPDARAAAVQNATRQIATPSAAIPAERPTARIEQRPMSGTQGQQGYSVKDFSVGPRSDRGNRTGQAVSDQQRQLMELFSQLPPQKAAELQSLVQQLLNQTRQ